MKRLLALTVVTFGITSSAAQAHPSDDARLVDSFYHRYLNRHVDPTGLNTYVRELRHGAAPISIEASILGSQEYYHLHGCTPEGFVIAMFRDVTGHAPRADELRHWVRHVRECHSRAHVALEFLRECRTPVTPVVVERPVVVHSTPVFVPSTVIASPVIVRPGHGHHHRPVYPAPGVSINLRFGR